MTLANQSNIEQMDGLFIKAFWAILIKSRIEVDKIKFLLWLVIAVVDNSHDLSFIIFHKTK